MCQSRSSGRWPRPLLEAAIHGDGSGTKDIAAGATSDQVRMLLQEQGVALICADGPARHPASAWPRVVDRLEAVSRIGGPVVGWINAPCASWPTPSADRYTGPWDATTRHPIWSSAPASTHRHRFATPAAPPGGSATPSC